MSSAQIPVDLRNPGQVFACLGLIEAIELLFDCEIESVFRGDRATTHATFEISSSKGAEAIREVIDFLRDVDITAIVPADSRLSTTKWNVAESEREDHISPSPVPTMPATLPVCLQQAGHSINLNYWVDGSHSGVDNVKFWAGSGGYPGAALARDIIDIIGRIPNSELNGIALDPFAYSAAMTSSFRFDWRRDYVPLDAGFSPNNHGNVRMIGYPFTEILAAIGLSHARPARLNARDNLHYRYGVWTDMLPNVFARPLLGGVDLGFPMRTFEMTLTWPGKEGQARCIIDAREETKKWNH